MEHVKEQVQCQHQVQLHAQAVEEQEEDHQEHVAMEIHQDILCGFHVHMEIQQHIQ